MFISIEGIEGTGKSTVAKAIQEHLQRAGVAVVLTREPGGTPVAEGIRQILLQHWVDDPMADDVELMLMFASRMQHMQQRVKPALNDGKWVVSDRFHDASFAYQGGGRGLSMQRIQYLSDWVLQGFKPDLTLLLDADPSLTFARIVARTGGKDRIEVEHKAFFDRVRATYLALAKAEPDRFNVIDVSQSFEVVMAQIIPLLDARLCRNED